MSRTQKLDRQLHRMLAGRRIAEVRRQMSPGGCNGLFIALDDGTVAILWLWPGEMTPLPRRIIQTHDALDRARKQSRGEWRKFYARALNRLRSWESGWNMPRNRRVNVRDRRTKSCHPQSQT